MIILLIIDAIFLILKTIFFIIFALDNDVSKKINFLYSYLSVEHFWWNYYDYTIVAVIIILILVYLIIREFD